jgi:hypothetical protein
MRLGHFAGDKQALAQAARIKQLATGGAGLAAIKSFKDMRQVLFRNSDPTVNHLNSDSFLVLHARGNHDMAAGIARGVDDIELDLAEPPRGADEDLA